MLAGLTCDLSLNFGNGENLGSAQRSTDAKLVMAEVDYVKKESEETFNADNFESQESEWQTQKELALLNAISKCKPVGKSAKPRSMFSPDQITHLCTRYAQAFPNHKHTASIQPREPSNVYY